MENAADAIKIAFSIFVFVLALTLTISVVGRARSAADVIFHFNDKTEFYEYATKDNVENSKDRTVGIETIIPTIHRYAKEQFAVTIFDKEGNPIVRYDLWTEGFMNNWDEIVKNNKRHIESDVISFNEITDRLQAVQDKVNKTIGTDKVVNADNVNNYIKTLYQVSSSINSTITVAAPWVGDNQKIQARIKADMLGKDYENNYIKYTGKNLKKYENNKFIETFLEITTSGETVTDDGYSLETIKGNKKLEIIYILQP